MRFLLWQMKSLLRNWGRNNVKLLSCCRLLREPVDAVHYLSNTHPNNADNKCNLQHRPQQRPCCKHVWRPGYSSDSSFDADWLMNVGKIFYNTLLWRVGESHFHSCQDCTFQKKTLVCCQSFNRERKVPSISRSSAQHQGRAPLLVCLAADPLAPSPSETRLFEIDGIAVLFYFCL